MSTLTLPSLARALGGEVSGSQVLAPGPKHSPRDRSLAVRLDPHAPGGFLVHSFCGDDPLEAKDHVRNKLGLPLTYSGSSEKGFSPDPVKRCAHDGATFAARTAQALRIWAEASDPRGTPVEAYLQRRGLELPHDAAGETIRFHPVSPFGGKQTPAMVCLVRDLLTNEPKAIHRTALTMEGRKVEVSGHDRLSLGPIGGGAIKLTPDPDVTSCLGVGEGLESTLSLRLAPEFGSGPVWCLLSAGGISSLPVLGGVECLWIAVDHDPAGRKAASTCSDRWRGASREVFLVTPRDERSDLNDAAKGDRHHA